ncbi:MAG TPA: cupin domain-containing protein [Gammaproteobacteria bacterium]
MLRMDSLQHLLSAAALAAALCGTSAHAQSPADRQAGNGEAAVTPLLTMPLADVPGKEASMVVVEYPPGGVSPPHRHNADVFVYVLEGSVVMQVEGGESVTLTAGQTFHESPSDVHTVSRNASSTEPAKFLVFFVKEEGAPSTVPASPSAGTQRERAAR